MASTSSSSVGANALEKNVIETDSLVESKPSVDELPLKRTKTSEEEKCGESTSAATAAGGENDFQVTLELFESQKHKKPFSTIQLSSSNNMYQIAEFLCNNILPSLRSPHRGGNGVNSHIWYFKFGYERPYPHRKGLSPKWIAQTKTPFSDEFDDLDCGDDIFIFGRMGEEDLDERRNDYTEASTVKEIDVGSEKRRIMSFVYDMGYTTQVFMRITVKEALEPQRSFPYLVPKPTKGARKNAARK